jgi:class 3 adenylate cyclase
MNMAVLVSDLSGFTSTTRKYGIVHFASVIIRMRQLCLPILNKRGAIFITTEADNLIVIFPDTIQATMAALEMQAVLRDYAKICVEENREHFKVKLNGVGLHCGKGLLVDSLMIPHGETFNTAYHIGEDLCDGGSVMISSAVRQVIEGSTDFAGASYTLVDKD